MSRFQMLSEFLKFGERTDPITLAPVNRSGAKGESGWELRQTGEVIARAVTSTLVPGGLVLSGR